MVYSSVRPARARLQRIVRTLAIAIAFLVGSGAGGGAQVVPPPPPGTDFVTVIAGEDYEASGFYRLFAGAGYRDLWTTPIRVPVADLAALGGGLTARRVGGGMTTRTLHLDGEDGRRYVLRSVDKVPADLIGELVGTPLEEVLQDQMSSFHPSGAVVVARLLEAVDVLHVTPTLVVVPDDPRLGEFREDFAGMLALFEERPDDGPGGTAGFAGARQVVQTDRLFEIMEEQAGQRIQTTEFLRSRLVDLLVGDRDRSMNNHLWAGIDQPDGGTLWRPIPRDRDQAFVQFDGVLKKLARYYDRRLVAFGSDYPNVFGLTRNAWDIDRTFLVSLSRAEWDATVAHVQARLDDDVIDEAVRRMPSAHHAVIGERLAEQIRARRDELQQASEELYRVVFESADVHLTDQDEVVTVRRIGDGSLEVLSEMDGETTFQRTFAPDETREVRLYLHGGDDVGQIVGGGPEDIQLRMIGGGGRDDFIDASGTRGVANLIYDGGDGTTISAGRGTRVHDETPQRKYSWGEAEGVLDWGTLTVPEPRFGYDEDRGLVLVAGVKFRRYGFLKDPYSRRLQVRAGYAFGSRQPIVDYRHFFRDSFLGTDVLLRARWSGLEVMNYYGLGNESTEAATTTFQKARYQSLVLSAGFSLGNGETRTLTLAPVLEVSRSDTTTTESFVGMTRPYGSGGFEKVGMQVDFLLDGRDVTGAPSRGYLVEGGGRLFPRIIDVEEVYGEVHATASGYLSPSGGNPTLAVRVGGKRLWGTYPFSDAAFLGGSGSVRGVREQRYAGDASAFGSAELRVKVARLWLWFPSDVGVFALGDMGRVFLAGEESDTWHRAFGGGIWVAPIRRTGTIQLSAAKTTAGEMRIYAGLGFAF